MPRKLAEGVGEVGKVSTHHCVVKKGRAWTEQAGGANSFARPFS